MSPAQTLVARRRLNGNMLRLQISHAMHCDSMTALYFRSPPASRGRSVRTGRQDAGHRRASLYHVRSSICDDDDNNNIYNNEAAVSVLSAVYTVSQKTYHLYNLL